MKVIHKPNAEMEIVNRIREIEARDESPPDRELRRLRGLSAEVGAACTAWLASRGIKPKSWGSFELKSRRLVNRTEFELHPED
jgi:hypothetical protein